MAHLARGLVTQLLGAWGVPTDDARSVITELAANAAEHGGRSMRIRLHHHGDVLNIEVTDTGTGRCLPHVIPDCAPIDGTSPRGRGLQMAAVLAERVTVHQTPAGATRAVAVLRFHSTDRTPPPRRPAPSTHPPRRPIAAPADNAPGVYRLGDGRTLLNARPTPVLDLRVGSWVEVNGQPYEIVNLHTRPGGGRTLQLAGAPPQKLGANQQIPAFTVLNTTGKR